MRVSVSAQFRRNIQVYVSFSGHRLIARLSFLAIDLTHLLDAPFKTQVIKNIIITYYIFLLLVTICCYLGYFLLHIVILTWSWAGPMVLHCPLSPKPCCTSLTGACPCFHLLLGRICWMRSRIRMSKLLLSRDFCTPCSVSMVFPTCVISSGGFGPSMYVELYNEDEDADDGEAARIGTSTIRSKALTSPPTLPAGAGGD